ncbi:MAG TPA: hypothetical protein DCQ98_00090 [Planctomycetaceae bacterium]|nr:hypothetical protein [Planctomycetaceae bacterium]
MVLGADQIERLAPDAASLAAGRKLAAARHWSALGSDNQALWGICQGSANYLVKFDRADQGYHCSCPSRKFPCKHVLALLLIVAQDPDAAPKRDEPEWVVEWLAKRRARDEKKTVRQHETASPADVDPQAIAKANAGRKRREAQRDERVSEGLERLDLWLHDLIRNGLADLALRGSGIFAEQAKRLVDAQAPGLANRVARWSEITGSGPDWHERLLAELGRTHLLIRAWRRIDELPAPIADELRQHLGWNVTQDRLDAEGEAVDDSWIVVGQIEEQEDRLRSQRTWLVGRQAGQVAMVLQFAPANQNFAESLVVGMEQAATLRRYPGTVGVRARIAARLGPPTPVTARAPGDDRIVDWLDRFADRIAAHPWLERFAGVLRYVRLARDSTPQSRHPWWIIDTGGDRLPLQRLPRRLAALTGGHPFDLAAEWDGVSLLPIGLFADRTWRGLP